MSVVVPALEHVSVCVLPYSVLCSERALCWALVVGEVLVLGRYMPCLTPLTQWKT